ncbi:MAG: hypothetical protein J0I06_14995 [Planctomycetes bacterium]|nr:hypothetical protein [Planctomycetota bacterium]
MAAVVEIKCPECENPLKVPEQYLGKKIKCKQCEHAFVAKDPKGVAPSKPGGVKPSKPGGNVQPSKPGGASVKVKEEKEEPKPESKPEAAAPYKFQDDDDDDGGAKPNPLGVVDEGADIPRCPFCAKELDPPDAVVCIHCGFNNVTRVRAESKKVWAPDSSDWMNHLGPGVLALVGCIALIVLDAICYSNMREWMTGTFLETDQPDVTDPTQKKLLVKPGAFITFVFAATVLPIIGLGRFAVKRLAIEYTPTEKVKK